MVVIGVCLLLVLAGLAAVARWGGLTVEPPPAPARAGSGDSAADPAAPPSVGLVARRYLWAVNLAVVAGVGALVVLATRARPVLAAWHAHRLVPAGQVLLAVVALLALPGFASAVASILGRS